MVAKGAVVPGSRIKSIAQVQGFENDPVLWEQAREAVASAMGL